MQSMTAATLKQLSNEPTSVGLMKAPPSLEKATQILSMQLSLGAQEIVDKMKLIPMLFLNATCQMRSLLAKKSGRKW